MSIRDCFDTKHAYVFSSDVELRGKCQCQIFKWKAEMSHCAKHVFLLRFK